MKRDIVRALSVVAVAVCVVSVTGCCRKPESNAGEAEGVGERTGAVLDKAVDKTAEVTSAAVEKTVDVQ